MVEALDPELRAAIEGKPDTSALLPEGGGAEAPPPPPPGGPAPLGWRRVTADGQIARGPVDLWGFILTGDGVGVADVALYDGANTSGRAVLDLWASTVESKVVLLPRPMPLEDGLYIDVGSNVTSLLVLFEPRRG
jgi:hypothetical protein